MHPALAAMHRPQYSAGAYLVQTIFCAA